MIAVDTSALMAVALDEPRASECAAVLQSDELIVSAMTLAEADRLGKASASPNREFWRGTDIGVLPTSGQPLQRFRLPAFLDSKIMTAAV